MWTDVLERTVRLIRALVRRRVHPTNGLELSGIDVFFFDDLVDLLFLQLIQHQIRKAAEANPELGVPDPLHQFTQDFSAVSVNTTDPMTGNEDDPQFGLVRGKVFDFLHQVVGCRPVDGAVEAKRGDVLALREVPTIGISQGTVGMQ